MTQLSTGINNRANTKSSGRTKKSGSVFKLLLGILFLVFFLGSTIVVIPKIIKSLPKKDAETGIKYATQTLSLWTKDGNQVSLTLDLPEGYEVRELTGSADKIFFIYQKEFENNSQRGSMGIYLSQGNKLFSEGENVSEEQVTIAGKVGKWLTWQTKAEDNADKTVMWHRELVVDDLLSGVTVLAEDKFRQAKLDLVINGNNEDEVNYLKVGVERLNIVEVTPTPE